MTSSDSHRDRPSKPPGSHTDFNPEDIDSRPFGLPDAETDHALAASDPELAATMRNLRAALQLSFSESESARTLPPIPGLPPRYQLKQELGRGSCGIVYRAADSDLKREVAIKILRPELMADENLKQRFLRESHAVARLSHSSIARVYEAGDSPQLAWQVSELVEGAPLSRHLHGQPLPQRTAARLVMALSDAVHHAHTVSVLHRDIKPDNVLLDRDVGESLEDATPRLTDFGLARIMDADLRMSVSGLMVGTPRYMAPEQVLGNVADHGPATDIYSLGAVLYELLAGQGPFHHAGTVAKRLSTIYQPVRLLRRVRPEVSRDLETICQKCLEPQPEHRYASAAELRDDLQRFLEGRSTLARPLPVYEACWRWSRRNPAWAALSAALLLALGLLLAISLRTNSQFRRHNSELTQVNQRLLQERERTQQLNDTAEQLRQEAVAERQKFQQFAWRVGLREAYSSWDRQRFAETDRALNAVGQLDAEAATRSEWRLLRQELDARFRRLLTLSQPVQEVRQIPNSNLIAAASEDGRVYLVDRLSGQIVRSITTACPALHALAVDPHGRWLATGGATHSRTDLAVPTVFDIATGALRQSLPGQPTTLESLEFDATGERLWIGARYENLLQYNLETRTRQVVPSNRRQRWMARSPDGQYLAAAAIGSRLVIAETEQPQHGVILNLEREAEAGAWLSNSRWLMITSSRQSTVQVLDVAAASCVANLEAESAAIRCLGSAASQGIVAAGSVNGELIVWRMPVSLHNAAQGTLQLPADSRTDGSDGQPVTDAADLQSISEWQRLQVCEGPITSLAVSDTGDWIVASSFAGEVVAVRTADMVPTQASPIEISAAASSQKPRIDWELPADQVPQITAVCNGRNGQSILAGYDDGSVHRLEFDEPGVSRSQMIAASPQSEQPCSAIAVDADPARWAWAAGGAVWLMESGEPRLLNGPSDTEAIQDLLFSRDGSAVAWTGDSRFLTVQQLHADASQPVSAALPGHGTALAWSADGRHVFCGGSFQQTIEYDSVTGQVRIVASHGANGSCLAVDPTGDRLYVGLQDGTLHGLPLKDGEPWYEHLHSVRIMSVALCPDQKIGVSCDLAGHLSVWYTDTGERIGFLKHMPMPTAAKIPIDPQVAFLRDGRTLQLFCPSENRTLRWLNWRLDSDRQANASR